MGRIIERRRRIADIASDYIYLSIDEVDNALEKA